MRSNTSIEPAERGLYEIRGLGAKRKLPTFDDLVFLTASLSRYPLEGYREKCVDQDGSGNALREKADRTRDPDNHRRHELRCIVGTRQRGNRPRRDGGWHLDHHRRRRHDGRRAQTLQRPWSISVCPRATDSIPTTCEKRTPSRSW